MRQLNNLPTYTLIKPLCKDYFNNKIWSKNERQLLLATFDKNFSQTFVEWLDRFSSYQLENSSNVTDRFIQTTLFDVRKVLNQNEVLWIDRADLQYFIIYMSTLTLCSQLKLFEKNKLFKSALLPEEEAQLIVELGNFLRLRLFKVKTLDCERWDLYNHDINGANLTLKDFYFTKKKLNEINSNNYPKPEFAWGTTNYENFFFLIVAKIFYLETSKGNDDDDDDIVDPIKDYQNFANMTDTQKKSKEIKVMREIIKLNITRNIERAKKLNKPINPEEDRAKFEETTKFILEAQKNKKDWVEIARELENLQSNTNTLTWDERSALIKTEVEEYFKKLDEKDAPLMKQLLAAQNIKNLTPAKENVEDWTQFDQNTKNLKLIFALLKLFSKKIIDEDRIGLLTGSLPEEQSRYVIQEIPHTKFLYNTKLFLKDFYKIFYIK